MNINKYIALLLLPTLTLCSCSEEEVPVFSSDRGVNFVLYDGDSDEYTDNYEQLSYEYNFFNDYPDAGFSLSDVSTSVGIQLEGTFSDEPITVHIKAAAVDGYDMPDIEFPSEVRIEAGEYRANFTVTCKHPADYDKVYKAELTFDYGASGLVAGTKERQKYVITLSDAARWDDMYVTNETEWNAAYSQYLGNYSPVKCRFIMVALGKNEDYGLGPYMGKSYSSIMYYYYYTPNKWGGFESSRVQGYLSDGLEWYEEATGEPLTENDGTPVTFKFMD